MNSNYTVGNFIQLRVSALCGQMLSRLRSRQFLAKMRLLLFLVISTWVMCYGTNPFSGQKFHSFGGGGKGASSKTSEQADDEYYSILGINRQATANEIKKAYRKQAMLMHPDKGGDAEKFKKLSEAYEVLSDEKKKDMYDRYGKAGQTGVGSSVPPDFANDFFGSFAGFSMPLMYTIEVSLEDLCKGRKLNIEVNGQELVINIMPGMYDGTELRAQVTDQRGAKRDVIFVIQEKEHVKFKRSNADLYMEMKISLREALLGFQRTVNLLDGTSMTMKSAEGEIYAPDDVLVVDNAGMPIYTPRSVKTNNNKGKLFVKLAVEFPDKAWLNGTDRNILDTILPPDDSPTTKQASGGFFGRHHLNKSKATKSASTVPRKSTLKSFGQSGKPPTRPTRTFDDAANFGSFFFR